MDGKYKLIIMLFFIVCSCKNEVKTNSQNGLNTNDERKFIAQNINVLIDSIESFDTSLIPASDEFKDLKVKKITIGLLDSVFIENDGDFNNINQKDNQLEYSKFKLHENDVVHFKSNYTLKLVKVNNYDGNVLFVKFSNLKFENNNTTIDVKKNIGISMIKERFYFVRQNKIWILEKKDFLSMG